MRGVRLSCNGLSSSGRRGAKVNLGTSDPQEPQKTCELQCRLPCHIVIFLMSDLRQMLSLWEDEGCTPPVSPRNWFIILNSCTSMCIDAFAARKQLLEDGVMMRSRWSPCWNLSRIVLMRDCGNYMYFSVFS